MSEVFVSPDGESRMKVATPETAIRMRARGWRPESEPVQPEPAQRPAPKPAAPKPTTDQS